jgi:hypothetical protein
MPPRPRRRRTELERRVEEASEAGTRALAHYELALFHDNNGWEAEAIPHYEAALANGLDGELRARCLAWLASSLHKSGRSREALMRLGQSLRATHDDELIAFLRGLERRARRRMGDT